MPRTGLVIMKDGIVEATKKRNIKVFNSPKGNCDAVAEHAIGLLLALANKLVIANNEVKQFSWNREKNRGFEIGGKTIGIIGLGHTGSSFARKLSGFETKIIAYDKYLVSKQDGLDHVEMVVQPTWATSLPRFTGKIHLEVKE